MRPNLNMGKVEIGKAEKMIQAKIFELYESTPELEKKFPKENSKILTKMKKKQEETKPMNIDSYNMSGELFNTSGSAQMVGMKHSEVPEYYTQLYSEYEDLKERQRQLDEDTVKKQERYIKREQEYRRTIEELQDRVRSTTNINNNNVKRDLDQITDWHSKIQGSIKRIQNMTCKVLQHQEKGIVDIFIAKIKEIDKEIQNERQKKADTSADFKERENELREHLELITNIAQRIDAENRALIKKNGELNIEFKSQENDRSLLLKQLLVEKKRTEKLTEEIKEYEKIINENKEKEQEEFKIGDEKEASYSMSRSSQRKKNDLSKNKIYTQSYPVLPQGTAPDQNERILRYEKIIKKLKRMLEAERKHLRKVRTMYSAEIQSRAHLEKLLRMCVEDVKNEISKKRAENRVLQHSLKKKGGIDELGLTAEDREKIIEVLLSQERVLTLLYDKTFPPKLHPKGLSENINFPPADNVIESNLSISSENNGSENEGNKSEIMI